MKDDHLGIKEAIRFFHKTYSSIYDQNIEKMLTLTISRKVMMNINLKIFERYMQEKPLKYC